MTVELQDIETAKKIASLETKVETIEDDIKDIQRDVKDIRDTLIGVKGSWKVVLAVAGIISTFALTVAQGFLGKFFG